MNRRDFLKIVGITTATSTAALYGCGSKEGSSEGSKVLGPIPTDKMTYRSFPGLGSDKVSILGYGCMRWPLKQGSDGKDQIDQEAVNRLVDYAGCCKRTGGLCHCPWRELFRYVSDVCTRME